MINNLTNITKDYLKPLFKQIVWILIFYMFYMTKAIKTFIPVFRTKNNNAAWARLQMLIDNVERKLIITYNYLKIDKSRVYLNKNINNIKNRAIWQKFNEAR